jgi:hypothetical protein
VVAVDLQTLLKSIDTDIGTELADMPEVVNKGENLDFTKLPVSAWRWHRLDDVVAVVADLKSSTQLGLNKHQRSTASIYEAATGNVVEVFQQFGADFVAVQGDGGFGLFWGATGFERAVTAGITIRTFSENHLIARLEKKWPEVPETGLRSASRTARCS